MVHSVAGVSGIVFVLLIILASVGMGDAPSVDSDPAVIRDYLQEDGGVKRVSGLFAAFALLFGSLFFAGVLRAVRAASGRSDGFWLEAARFGAIIVLACVVVADVALDVLFFRDGAQRLDDSAVRLLWDAQVIAYSVMGVGVALLTAGIAAAAFDSGAMPRWHAWLGVLAALIALLGPFALLSPTEGGELLSAPTFPALLIWALATSIVMLRNRNPGPVRAEPAPSSI